MNKKLLLASIILYSLNTAEAFLRTHDGANFFRPADSTVKLPYLEKTRWQLGSRFEYGRTRVGRNYADCRRNILQIHDEYESALHMIENPSSCLDERLTTPSGGNLRLFLQTVPRDGVRGTQCLTGKFSGWDWTLFGHKIISVTQIPGAFRFSVHVPLSHKKISHVAICDRTNCDITQATAPFDLLTKQFITQDLRNNVQKWGCLDLSEWEKTGLGDIVCVLEWKGVFPQKKENLKEVDLSGRVGVSIPTGEAKDEDKAFSMPMGNDGAWAVPFGISLGLNFLHKIRAGIDADFLALFDTRRVRRLKTVNEQTEFLLLNKGLTLKEYGLTWQFHLYVQAYHFAKGLSASCAYDYVKHDGDRLIPKTNAFDTCIVNTAHSLKEWNVHNLIFKLNYDITYKSYTPQLELFYKLPVSGKNVIDPETFGIQVAINF